MKKTEEENQLFKEEIFLESVYREIVDVMIGIILMCLDDMSKV